MLAKTPAEMEENTENFLDALNAFERKPSREIPNELEELLCRIARNGEPLFPWSKLKPLVVTKLENVIQEYIQSNPCEEVPMLPNVENVKFDDMRERLLRSLNAFNSAPFTMQRLCELLTHPKRYYQRSDKFMRGVEKNVQVVSTITPTGKRITHSCEVRNQTLLMNGIPSDTTHTQTSPASSDSQPLGAAEPTPPSDETSHTNGNTAIPPQKCDVAVPQPDDAVVCPPASSEPDVDSTRQSTDASVSKPVTDISERTSSSTNESSLLVGVRDNKELSSEHNEAEACKPMEVEERTGTGDSDDSDGNKGDVDQDSCSSMDSADSGGSSPDSALPPSTGFFNTLHPKVTDAAKDTTPDQKAHDPVDSSSCSAVGPPKDEDKSTSAPGSMPQPDQSHSSIAPPAPGREQQSPPPPPPPPSSVTSAGAETTDTRTDRGGEKEVTPAEGISSPETVTSEALTSEAATSEALTSEALTFGLLTSESTTGEAAPASVTTAEALPAEALPAEAATAEASSTKKSSIETSTAEASTSEASTSDATTSEASTSESSTTEAWTASTAEASTAESSDVEMSTSQTATSAASSTEASTSEASTTDSSGKVADHSQQEADQSDVISEETNVDKETPMEQD